MSGKPLLVTAIVESISSLNQTGHCETCLATGHRGNIGSRGMVLLYGQSLGEHENLLVINGSGSRYMRRNNQEKKIYIHTRGR